MEENHSTKVLLNQIDLLKKEINAYKNTEIDLKKSIFFNTLIEQAGDGFELLDEHGKFVDANSVTCEQLGYSKEELLKKYIWEIDDNLTEQEFYERFGFIKDNSPFRFEATHKRKDGTLFPVEVSVSIIEFGNKTYSLSLSRDISERKKYEFNLIKERNKARQILETIESIIVAIDINGNVSMINRKGCEVLGYSENEIIGKNWFKNYLPQPAGIEKMYPVFKQLISGSIDGIGYLENDIVTKNDEIKTIAWHNSFLIEEDGKISGILSSGEDITEKLRIKNQLLNSERLLKDSQSVAKLGHYEFDVLTGLWTSSDQLNNIFGINSDYHKDVNSWLDIVHPDFQKEMQDYLIQHVLTEGKFFDKPYKIKQKNTGKTLWVHGLGSLIYNDEGKPIKMFGTIQDINNSKLAEISLKEKNEEYEALNEELIQANELLIKAKVKAEESEKLYREKNEEYEALNEELRQTNEELIKAKDITEESERRIRTMFSSSNAGFVIINTKGKLIEWNKTFIEYFGYTDDEFKDLSSKDITYFEDVEESFFKLGQIISGEITDFRIEKRFVRKDKTIFWTDMFVSALKKKDTVIAFIGVVNDITFRKEFEKQLIEAKEKAEVSQLNLNEAQKIGNVSSWEYNLENGITIWSENAYRMFGIEPYSIEVSYEYFRSRVHKDDLYIIDEAFTEIYKKRDAIKIEIRIIVNENEIKWLNIDIVPFFAGDKLILLKGTNSDITERKARENELKIAKENAEESDKLKSAFLANVSHEIRTPMNGIMGFAQMLTNPDVPFEKRKFYSEIITNNCNQLLNILNDILDVSKIETGQMKIYNEDVNINNVMLEMTSFFKPHATKSNINLFSKKEVPDEFAIIKTDLTKLRQIFTNLLSNAIKFTNRGMVEFGYTLKKDHVEFYVKDTGIGILSDLQDKIFDRFRQAETSFTKNYGGTGLGLSISKGYVELMGGKIWLESEINKGTTFFFSIPINESDKILQYQNHQKESKKNQKTILVAEDEEINYLFIEEVLLPFQIKLIHAKNGQEAIDYMQQNNSIDLILMDIKMPIKNGFEATDEIRKINSNIPIIAQTAYALSEDIEKLSKFGFNDILTKPMTENRLIILIDKYLKIKK